MKQFTEWQESIIEDSGMDVKYVMNWESHVEEWGAKEVVKILSSRALWRIGTIDELERMIELMKAIGANHIQRASDKEGNNWITLGYKRTQMQLLDIEIQIKQKELDVLLNKKNRKTV